VSQKKTYNSWLTRAYLSSFFLLCFVFFGGLAKAGANELTNYKINLYGHEVEIQFCAPIANSSNLLVKENITEQIKQFEATDLSNLIIQMDNYSSEFGMDDMAYLLFTQKVGRAIFGSNQNTKIFEYTLLKRKGYKILMGYSSDEITVYGYLDFKVLNGTYVTYQGLVYTDLTFDQNLEPCQEQLLENPVGGRAIIINENRAPFYNALEKKYNLRFDFESTTYYYKGIINQSLAAYYRELPDIEFGPIYLNYQLSDKAKNCLVNDIKSDIEGMWPMQQIDFLLSFAQQAIPYKKDIEAIGKEKFAFPEEVLSNNFADCEDKSVLFAYLVKEIYKRQTVALIYFQEHHLNVAVAINSKDGYSFVYNNQKYIVCEPSGIGFVPGENAYDLKKASIVNW
jgi:hypothetical protein